MSQENTKKIVVVGGGIAGIETAKNLASTGFKVTLLEQSDHLGGHAAQWDRVFPDQRPASEIIENLTAGLSQIADIVLNARVTEIIPNHPGFTVKTISQSFTADIVVLATGFKEFNARRKEEYGYGIYENVITSVDLEKKLKNSGHQLLTSKGKIPSKVAIIHCVGSRDEKTGNTHCSKVCCITAVKQAIEIKQVSPSTEVYCFYMDLRMFNLNYEDIYKQAQLEYSIQFIRGRLSEAFESPEGTIALKVEDTLSSKPMKISVDMVILMIGIEPSDNELLFKNTGIGCETHGFIKVRDYHLNTSETSVSGIYVTGTATGPANITETLNHARALSFQIKNLYGN